MATQTCSARPTPGVWFNSVRGGIPAILGIALAGLSGSGPALFAQTGAARLARGISNFESRHYNDAIQDLKAAQPQVPKLADYAAYYLAASRVELKDFEQARKDLAPFKDLSTPSPLESKAALLEAKSLTEMG